MLLLSNIILKSLQGLPGCQACLGHCSPVWKNDKVDVICFFPFIFNHLIINMNIHGSLFFTNKKDPTSNLTNNL